MKAIDTLQKFKDQFKGKKVTIMGLGLLGRGVGDARFFAECGADVLVTDLKTEEQLKDSIKELEQYANITFVLGLHQEKDFANADIIIKGNNVPLDNKFIKAAESAGVRVAMSVALFAQYAHGLGATIVGITGTRGKSTVTQMIYDSLRSEASKLAGEVLLGGNVRGVSTIALAIGVKAGDTVVLELDSWILQGFAYEDYSPHIAIFTNFYPDHLNYYKSMDEYFADKSNIFKYQKLEQGDTLIVGDTAKERVHNANPPVDPLEIVPIPKDWTLAVPGVHNRENAALAREALQALGMGDEKIKESLEKFGGVEGRLEHVGEFNEVKIYNDNNATTPEATIVGINALSAGADYKNIVLIAGGTDKGTELDDVAQLIKAKCKAVHLIEGTGTSRLLELLPKVHVHTKFAAAILSAIGDAEPGDIVLFSPLFSSFGKEFANEYERNDTFKKIIKDYYGRE